MLDAVAQVFLGRIDQAHDLRPSAALFHSAVLNLTIMDESAVFHVTSFCSIWYRNYVKARLPGK